MELTILVVAWLVAVVAVCLGVAAYRRSVRAEQRLNDYYEAMQAVDQADEEDRRRQG